MLRTIDDVGPVAYESVVDSALLRPKLGPSKAPFLYSSCTQKMAEQPQPSVSSRVPEDLKQSSFIPEYITRFCGAERAPNAASSVQPQPRCFILDDLLSYRLFIPSGSSPCRPEP